MITTALVAVQLGRRMAPNLAALAVLAFTAWAYLVPR